MITALAIGLLGAGIALIYAVITGQNFLDELKAALGRSSSTAGAHDGPTIGKKGPQ